MQNSFYTQMKGKSAMSNNGRAYTNWDGRIFKKFFKLIFYLDVYRGIGDPRKLQWILSDIGQLSSSIEEIK